jgi:hypothetical protein
MPRLTLSIVLASLMLLAMTQTSSAQDPDRTFEFHGIVEGFYGEPWSHEARLDMLRFMGEVGFNTFFYAPKDDPYHRSRWREPYPEDALAKFREMFEASQAAGTTFYYAISPGLSIEYSSDEDYRALIAKIDAMMEQGVRHFALFVDDVPEQLAHESDRSRFANLGEAHVYIINKMYDDLQQRGAELIVCPTTYTDAWGDREYIRILGEGIPQDIPLFWTGTDVAVEVIPADDARTWGRIMNRPPLIWDNFPVNDYDTWRPFLGPLRGRDAELASTTRGIIANPMVEPWLSLIPLYTVADYARDPFGYDPDESLENALTFLYGEEAAEIIRPVVALYEDFGWDFNLFRSLQAPGEPVQIERLEQAQSLIQETVSTLRRGAYAENRRLQGALDELEKFHRITEGRIEAVSGTRGYAEGRDSDGRRVLEFDVAFDTYASNRVMKSAPGDGRLCDWNGHAFHNLKGDGEVRTAFQHDDDYLYIAVDVRTDRFYPTATRYLWDSDHVSIAVDRNPADTSRFMKPGDILLQLGAPDADSGEFTTMLTTMALTEHSARGAMDLVRARLSHFYQFFAVEPGEDQDVFERVRHTVRKTEDGYFAEAAIPREGRSEIRLDIGYFDQNVVTEAGAERRTSTTGTLSTRGYLFNPKSYARVVME